MAFDGITGGQWPCNNRGLHRGEFAGASGRAARLCDGSINGVRRAGGGADWGRRSEVPCV